MKGGVFMAVVTTVFTAITGFMGDIVGVMTTEGNEIMLIPVGIFVAGAAIGLAGRLIGR
jgi:hypothetical protein